MALSTYSELEDAVSRYLDRTDRDTEIQEWVRLTELEVERKLNLRAQQLSVSGTLAGGSEYIETPVGVLYPQMLVFDSQPPAVVDVVSFADGEEFAFGAAGSAVPSRATVWGVNPSTFATRIRVWPPPSGSVDYTLHYTVGVTPLTAAAPTNYLLSVAADVYLYGCLFHGHMFDENPEGASTWRPMFDEQIRTVKRIESFARAKAGRLRVRPQFATP